MVRQWVGGAVARPAGGGRDLYERLLAVVEPPLLEAVLAHHGGQRAAAAEQLGLHRATLRKKLRQFRIGEETP